MDVLIENPGIMVAALVLTSVLGGAIGFILRGWYDESRSEHLQRDRSRRPGSRSRGTEPGSGGRAGDRQRTVLPPSRRGAAGWEAAAGVTVSASTGSDGEEGPLVLLVDDRLELLALHSAYLHEHGYRVLTAGDGQTGLEYARAHHPDVMVVDHSMPRRTGVEVARELKGDPRTAHIPILMMTAHSYGAVGTAAREAGCETFLPKPVDPSRMLREVSLWAAPLSRP